jgi:hypothetical protein
VGRVVGSVAASPVSNHSEIEAVSHLLPTPRPIPRPSRISYLATTDSILEVITGKPQSSCHPCMCPKTLVWLAGRVCPF